MTTPLIKLDAVRKVFYTDEVETHALDNINLEIGKGEYVSIAGPSGCGKSTLLSILGLLDTPTDGQYVLNERKKKVRASLERVGMLHRQKHYPAQLSGGQQQRVAVARAVVGDPLILLADEPTGNLDSTSGHAVMDLLEELHREGATICMVTHDPRYAEYAGRQVHLFDGRIIEDEERRDRVRDEEALEELRESGYEIDLEEEAG